MKIREIHTTMMLACGVALLAGLTTARAGQTDNAALLYYQAFLLYEKPDATMEQMLADLRARKIDSNETVREYLEKNQRVIDYVVKAAGLPHCDWGYDYSLGIDLTFVNGRTVKPITFLLGADALVHAEGGDYRTALERCLTAHRMALHIVDRPLITYLIGIGTSGYTNGTIQKVLATMPGDTETLRRFQTQVREIEAAFPLLENVLVQEGQICAATMRKDKAPVVLRFLGQDDPAFAASLTAQRLQAGDDAFFERNRAHWFNSIAALVAVLKSGQPYLQTYTQLNEVTNRLEREAKDNPDATFTAFSLPAAYRIYALATRLEAHFRALTLALDLYVIKAKTGKLPASLPPGAPLDPFSGQPFTYEKAADHFTLRCQAREDPEKEKINEYEFTIKP